MAAVHGCDMSIEDLPSGTPISEPDHEPKVSC